MGLFNTKTQPKTVVSQLMDESAKHMNVFKSTADGLKDVNQKIEVEQDKLQLEIDLRKLQHSSLQDIKNENAKVEAKIRAFLED